MEKINLTKYGFIRSKEEDFRDDGNRFKVYRAGLIKVTKCSYGDEIFISGDGWVNGSLPYGVYSKLSHYRSLDELNGVKKDSITEQDLINLYNNCLLYQEEYKEAEANIKYPSKEELENKAQELQSQAMELLNKLEAAIQEAGLKIFNLSDYDLRALKHYYNTTKEYTKLKDINPLINNSSSFSFMKRNIDTYEFNKAMEILNK